jgi:phosphoenolpyruvate phosphomutase
VRGHRGEAIDVSGARFVDNPDFASTGEAWSLALAEDALVPGTLVAYGDVVLKRYILRSLLEEAGSGITLVVDSALAGIDVTDRVLADRADTGRFSFEAARLTAIGDAVAPGTSHGAWIGVLHLGNEGAGAMTEAIGAARADGTLRTASLLDVLARVRDAGHPIRIVWIRGGWVNVNNLLDLLEAGGIDTPGN